MKKFIPWLGAAAILVIIFGTMYGMVQQSQRMDANWPQIQIAEDTAAALNSGAQASSLTGKVNMNVSLASFTIIYDKSGRVVSGSGYLNGTIPTAPLGILRAASGKTYHTITWQPQSNVRIAAITVAANNYYVLSGRSLAVVEANENKTMDIALIGSLLSLIILTSIYFISPVKTKK